MTDAYALLDSGNGRRLDQVGPYVLDRSAPQAVWKPRLPAEAWKAAAGFHHRSETGGGKWQFRVALPDSWEVDIGGVRMIVRPTPFGHLGLFAEHASQWSWMADELLAPSNPRPSVLNLFAYSGGATLACARAGAETCHVDAAQGIVAWARDNARLNGLAEHPIRWITDDCRDFVERERRRGRRYDALLLDPPSFGRGTKKQVWKIEDDLPALLEHCRALLSDTPRFVLLTAHTPGYTPVSLGNLLQEFFPSASQSDVGEMTILDATGRALPSGAFARVRFP